MSTWYNYSQIKKLKQQDRPEINIDTRVPGVSDDILQGYYVGSKWLNASTMQEYVLLDSTAGAASWVPVSTTSLGGSGTSLAGAEIIYYVDPSGDDSSAIAGDRSQPWASPKTASEQAFTDFAADPDKKTRAVYAKRGYYDLGTSTTNVAIVYPGIPFYAHEEAIFAWDNVGTGGWGIISDRRGAGDYFVDGGQYYSTVNNRNTGRNPVMFNQSVESNLTIKNARFSSYSLARNSTPRKGKQFRFINCNIVLDSMLNSHLSIVHEDCVFENGKMFWMDSSVGGSYRYENCVFQLQSFSDFSSSVEVRDLDGVLQFTMSYGIDGPVQTDTSALTAQQIADQDNGSWSGSPEQVAAIDFYPPRTLFGGAPKADFSIDIVNPIIIVGKENHPAIRVISDDYEASVNVRITGATLENESGGTIYSTLIGKRTANLENPKLELSLAVDSSMYSPITRTGYFDFVDPSNPLNNYSATVAPAVGDDEEDGYSVGSKWYDTVGGTLHECVDATAGAAVWITIG